MEMLCLAPAPDTRTATVVSGVWYFGSGAHADEAATRALPTGSFYTEPAGVMHFASTRAEPVVLDVTGFGPSSTTFVGATQDGPRP